jgi:ABC-type glycerol-3-phosphate transport system substrate-binding protein
VAFLKGLIDPAKAPEFKVAYQLMKQDSHFWEPGFLSYNGNDVYTAFSGGQSMQFMNGTWFIPSLEGTLRAFKALGQTNKVFQPGAFPYPTITPENTPLLKMGGINQNNGPRNGFWIPKHLSPDKLAAAIDFLQFLTAPKNVTLAYSVVVNAEQTVAGKKLMTKVPAIADPPAVKGVPYQIAGGAFKALTPYQQYADLGGPSATGYDTQSTNEFIAAWQQYLGGNMAIEAFLQQVSQIHLRALERLLRQQAGTTVDWNFVNSQLKGIPHISH